MKLVKLLFLTLAFKMNRFVFICFTLIYSVYKVEAGSCECGLERAGTRIIGGGQTIKNRYPWMVGMKVAEKSATGIDYFTCGGSLINDRYILTAAHCVAKAEQVWVTLGAHHESEIDKNIEIQKVIVHEGFDPKDRHVKNDIALLRLPKPVTFSDTVGTICMPTFETKLKPKNLFAIGWGVTDPAADTSEGHLMEVDLPFAVHRDCLISWAQSKVFVEEKVQLCAGNVTVNICTGDSGGPLSTREQGKVIQIGINSYVDRRLCGTAQGSRPSVFTRVAGYLPWIEKNIGDAVNCS